MSNLDMKEVQALLESVAKADINELVLETGDYKLSVSRGQPMRLETVNNAANPTHLEPTIAATQTSPAPAALEAPSSSTPSAAASPPSNAADNLSEVQAPIVGTFYSAPSPDAAPFVKEGDRVQVGQVLCIIEAMKLMNEIEAEVAGTIVEICVRNEDPVEYGQALFTIDPS